MSTASINTKIKMDGEAEYKAALASVNSSLKELDSELKLSETRFKENADSMEALSEKHNILSERQKKQQEKVETLKRAVDEATIIQEGATKALEKAAKTMDTSSLEYKDMADQVRRAGIQTETWKTKLNNAERALLNTDKELKENAKAMEDTAEATKKANSYWERVKQAASELKEDLGPVGKLFQGLGDTITDVSDKLGIKLPDSVQSAVKALNGINTGAALAVTGVGLIGSAVATATKALVSTTKASAEYAKEVEKTSSVTGVSTTRIQQMSYAAGKLGVETENVQDAMKELTNKMQEARDGNEETAAAFEKLGVAIGVEGSDQLRRAEDVFYDVVDALGEMKNSTERDAVAMDLMSESAQQLNPLIDAGSDAMKDYYDEASEMGHVLDNETLTALNDVDQGLKDLNTTTESVKNKMSGEFVPYMSEALGDLTEFIGDVGTALVDSGAVEAFGEILVSVSGLLEPLAKIINALLPALIPVIETVADIVADIAEFAEKAVDYVMEYLGLSQPKVGFEGEYSGAEIGGGFGGSGNKYIDAEQEAYYAEQRVKNAQGLKYSGMSRYASGTDWFYGGRTLLSENGAEMAILPQGTRILTAQETREVGGDTWYITIDAKNVQEFNDIVRLAQSQRRVGRMEGTR